jgi:hypothetical protein
MKKKRVVRSVEKNRLSRKEREEEHQREAAGIVPNTLNEFEAARYLGNMKVTTLRTWRVRGGGPAFARVGVKLIRYPVTALDEFIAQGMKVSTSTPSPAA